MLCPAFFLNTDQITLTRIQAMIFCRTLPADPLRKKITNTYIWSELCGPILAASKQNQTCKKLVD